MILILKQTKFVMHKDGRLYFMWVRFKQCFPIDFSEEKWHNSIMFVY